MLDCLLSEGRKGKLWGSVYIADSSDDDDDYECPPEQWRQPDVELQSAGVRRNRTELFARMRAVRSPKRRTQQRRPCTVKQEESKAEAEEAQQELRSIFDEISQAHTSLASKLAQHNGMRQFGADFANRVPPLELRMLIPLLETSIEQALETLELSIARLEGLQVPAVARRSRRVREKLARHARGIREEAHTTFEQQRQHLRELARASPLFSPMLMPALGKRLAEAMSSPAPSSTTASPKGTPKGADLAPLTCLELPPAEPCSQPSSGPPSEGDLEEILGTQVQSKPFSSVLSMKLIFG